MTTAVYECRKEWKNDLIAVALGKEEKLKAAALAINEIEENKEKRMTLLTLPRNSIHSQELTQYLNLTTLF